MNQPLMYSFFNYPD